MESFYSKVKRELSELNNLSNKKLVRCELQGYLLVSSENKFVTENEYNINRFGKLLSNSGIPDFKIEMQGNKFCITTKKEINLEEKIEDEEEARALIRGAFLGGGSITNPKGKYHLEIVFQIEEYAKKVINLLLKFNINTKIVKREKNYVVYIKDGEEISDFLAFIGANKAVLEFEQTRVIREVRNNVNRIVNCETANLNKVVKTSVKQIENIKLIKSKKKFNKLSEGERELALLRLNNPESSLAELGNALKKPIGKSGVNHRMKRISDLAEEIRRNEG